MSCYSNGHRCGENGCKCVCTVCEGANDSDNTTVGTTNASNAAGAKSNAGNSSRRASLAAPFTDSSRGGMSRTGVPIGTRASLGDSTSPHRVAPIAEPSLGGRNSAGATAPSVCRSTDGARAPLGDSTSPHRVAPIAEPSLGGRNSAGAAAPSVCRSTDGARAPLGDSTSPHRVAPIAEPFRGDDDEPPGLFDRITHHRNLRNGVVAVHRPAAPPPTYKVLDLTGDKTTDNGIIFGTLQYQYIDEYIGYDPRRRDDAFYCPEAGDGELLHAVVYQDAMEVVYLINWRLSEKTVLQERYLTEQFNKLVSGSPHNICKANLIVTVGNVISVCIKVVS